ncbi:MAG: O-antigen ligase family protein [Acidobacteriota bacterium]|nr:O-antigen ligase family protein [Acidobacteriota bacterium]
MKLPVRLRALAREAIAPEGADGLDSIAFSLLLILGALVPVFYEAGPAANRQAMGGGATLPRGDILLELFAFMIAAATFLSGSRARSLRPLRVPLGAMSALAVLGCLQLLPFPRWLLSWVAPVNLEIYHDSAGILGLFSSQPAPRPRISIAPTETVGTVLLILAYLSLFLAAANLMRTRPRRRLFVATIFVSAVLQILFALLIEGPRRSAGADEQRLHGLFVNPNHFAGYLEIVLALGFAAIWTQVLVSGDRVSPTAEGAERYEKRLLPVAGRVLLWAVLAVAVGATESRGGILAVAVTTATLLAMAVFHRRVRFPRRALLGAAIALLAGMLFVAKTTGSEPFLRFLKLDPRDLANNTRVALWRTSLRAWELFPVVGSGLGTFREAFRRVQPRELEGLVEQAHSDSLQLLVTGGLVGELLGILLFTSLFILLIRAWRQEKHREEATLILGGIGALLSLTLHGLLDFNLSIPAIPALLACVLGTAWAAGRSR